MRPHIYAHITAICTYLCELCTKFLGYRQLMIKDKICLVCVSCFISKGLHPNFDPVSSFTCCNLSLIL